MGLASRTCPARSYGRQRLFTPASHDRTTTSVIVDDTITEVGPDLPVEPIDGHRTRRMDRRPCSGRTARPPRQGVPGRTDPERDRRPDGRDRCNEGQSAPPERRRDDRASRTSGSADGPQRLPRGSHTRRHDNGAGAAQHRSTDRGSPTRGRRHRRRDRCAVRVAGRGAGRC